MDDEAADEEEVEALDWSVEEAAEDAAATAPPPNRFYCSGYDRKDDDGKRLCDYRSPKRWYTPCPKCGRWFACREIKRVTNARSRTSLSAENLSKMPKVRYYTTHIAEVDHILGGGLVPGKTVLFGGEKGAGKTTLLLDLATRFATPRRPVLYASGEDDRDSVVQFAQRIGRSNGDVEVIGDPRGLNIETVIETAKEIRARLIIIDSLQVCEKANIKADFGQAAQVDAVIQYVTSFAKQSKTSVIMIGQLVKDGRFSGTERVLHLVDVLARFDRYTDDDGRKIPGAEKVRELWLDGKTRQGDDEAVALMEMDDNGRLGSLSPETRARLSELEMADD